MKAAILVKSNNPLVVQDVKIPKFGVWSSLGKSLL